MRAQRKRLRLTQKQLADLAGCGPDFLYDVERGKPTVRLDKLMPVLEALGLGFTVAPLVKGSVAVSGAWISPFLEDKER